MDDLSNVSAFLKVVEKGSMTAAAAALHCSASTISKRIKQLEHTVGATLLNRSTHGNARPTEAGQSYFEQVRMIVRGLENARDSVRKLTESLEGQLRVHLTPGTGILVLPAIFRFAREYPALKLLVSVRPEEHDVLGRGFDVSIHSQGSNAQYIGYTSIEARELVAAKHVICAAKSYLDTYGIPAKPEDLVHHNCLVSIRQPSPHKWWFHRDGQRYSVNVGGNFEADNWITIQQAAIAGLGIVRMLRLSSQVDIGDDLVPFFVEETVSDRSLWALMPRMQPTPRKVEVFLSFICGELRRQVLACE